MFSQSIQVNDGERRDGDHEPIELDQSPRFPPRSRLMSPPSPSQSSTPQRHSPEAKSEQGSESDTTKSSGSSRRRLQFKGKDVLNIVTRKRTTSSSSNDGSEKSPSRPSSRTSPFLNKVFHIPKLTRQSKESTGVDSRVKTASGQYSVAPRDVSVLERISHKAQNRAQRVRKPHEVFVELEELRHDDGGEEWEETARWIKFEEDVEEGSGRWGRPHVSALAFHSLVDLRKGLKNGCVLLDVEGEDFPQIAQEITSHLVLSGQLPPEHTDSVLRVLLKKHKHTHDVTLWEKMKQSALGPESRLHSIGEGLRKISHSHRLADLVPHGSGGNIRGHGPGGSLKRNDSAENLVMPLKAHRGPEFGTEVKHSINRICSAPQMAHQFDLHTNSNLKRQQSHDQSHDPSHDNHKKVLFNIAGSDEGLQFCSDSFLVPPSSSTGNGPTSCNASDITGVTGSTFVSDISINIEQTDVDEKVSNGGMGYSSDGKQEDTVEESVPPASGILKQKTSVLSLMDKIPDEAESLTVLVGGVKFLEEPVVAFVRLAQSHLLGDLTEVPIPVRFIFLQLGPSHGETDYHEVGRAMATLMSDAMFHDTAYSAVCQDDIMDAIDNFLDNSIVLPPGDWDQDLLLPIMQERNQLRRRKARLQEKVSEKRAEDPLKHSRRPLGGIWKDLKKLGRRYRSDITDALSVQVILSILFMYITLLGPAIAFGGLMEEITGNIIGETETLLATGLAGIIYGLFAVQPISILALTGPVLLFETIIFRVNDENFGLPYIQWRAMIGLWLMVLLIIASVTELSFLIHYFTRFSEEVFTGIIGLFFAYEASLTLVHIFERNPLCGINYPCGKYATYTNNCVKIDYNMDNMSNMTGDDMLEGGTMLTNLSDDMMIPAPALPRGFLICNQPNTFLWSFILAFGTFAIALFFRKLRKGKFLGKQGRRLVSDFGVLTAIAVMVVVAVCVKPYVPIEVIIVASNYATTLPERGWFINPFDGSISVLAAFGAFIPAALVFTLIFIENQLTVIEINKADHKLRKEVGYHWDLLIVGILSGLFGLLGVPWMCAAAVRSYQHLQALSVFTSHNPPGEKPKLIKIHEQRVTNIVVHILIIITPFAYKVLEIIPIAVLLGIFYYLAFASLKGVQLSNRVKLIITPVKHHPKIPYVTKVRTLKMHLYTFIQLLVIATLFGVKLSPASMVYPLVIVFLIPLKWFLGKYVFTKLEMEALDNEGDNPEELEEGEFGEYVETTAPY